MPGDGQAKTGAAVFARGGNIRLTERLKKAGLRCRRNADAGVLNLKSYGGVRFGLAWEGDPHRDLSLFRELNGISNKVGKDLPQPPRIAAQPGVDIGGNF